jgi:transposase, IS30 family
VLELLDEDWSPEQVALWLRREHPQDRSRWVSHETIYRSLCIAGRTELGREAGRRLRSGRSVRRPRLARKTGQGRGRLRNMVSIRDRPEAADDRTELGHWEGDLVMGKRPSAVATLVERSSGQQPTVGGAGYANARKTRRPGRTTAVQHAY